MNDYIDKKQMHDSGIKWKANAFKECNYIVSIFLMSFNISFVFG